MNLPHPDTGRPVIGAPIPDWLVDLVNNARGRVCRDPHPVLGRRTDGTGPVFLEVNSSGDLNLPQLANGKGVFDYGRTGHLWDCGRQI